MINLIPEDHREQVKYGRKNSQILTWLSTVAFGAVILLAVALVGRLTIQTAKNQALEQKVAIEEQITASDLSLVEKDYNSFVNGVGSVKKVYQQQILYSRLIRKMATLLPPGARLTTISLSDKDRAVNLNFDNDKDGLGPTIQINLQNQGAQIAEKNRLLTETGFSIKTGGKLQLAPNGTLLTEPTVSAASKTVEYYINSGDSTGDVAKLAEYTASLSSGGEYAYALAKPSLTNANYMKWLDEPADTRALITGLETLPQMVDYSVDEASKSVDFIVRADSISDAKKFESILNTSPNSQFIETYVFEDGDYQTKNKCTDKKLNKQTCETICRNNLSECEVSDKDCKPKVAKGCQYVVRAYYDELFTGAKVEKLDAATIKTVCPSENAEYLPCTHKVTATYEPLFEKVDINRITQCSIDQTTGVQSCIVEMRAEFGANAKFYLVNAGGTS